ncbi:MULTISPECIES: hypothetical protein [Halorussus]|uniref:hypothetical protein n=1 Tax=Halorussus TaxID=1070314 RepID=UPI00209FBC75|nr:hypothetical protein [Halorussus vallis]USZ75021.1 hypothetical protein NGM07_16475 [Halorussus vallis]
MSPIEALQAVLLDSQLNRENLSSKEREIILHARGDSYRESHPYSSAFKSILKQLDKWAYLDGNITKDGLAESDSQHRLLQYDDRYYRYTLRFDSEQAFSISSILPYTPSVHSILVFSLSSVIIEPDTNSPSFREM